MDLKKDMVISQGTIRQKEIQNQDNILQNLSKIVSIHLALRKMIY